MARERILPKPVPPAGQDFEDFLQEQGIAGAARAEAQRRINAWLQKQADPARGRSADEVQAALAAEHKKATGAD
jgi:hypothetical protein